MPHRSNRGELSPLVSVIIAAVLIVLGVALVLLFYHKASLLATSALNAPEVEVSADVSGSTGVVTIDVYNAGSMPINVTGVRVYGSGGSLVSCSWENGVGSTVVPGSSVGIVGTCSGLSSGYEYTIVVIFGYNGGSFTKSLSVVAS